MDCSERQGTPCHDRGQPHGVARLHPPESIGDKRTPVLDMQSIGVKYGGIIGRNRQMSGDRNAGAGQSSAESSGFFVWNMHRVPVEMDAELLLSKP